MQSDTRNYTCWSLWCLIVLAVAGIHAVTLRISPTVWQDEVQIIDHGRSTLNGSTSDWALNWSVAGRPQCGVSRLGCAMQEISYQAAGGDLAGPRTSALLGAIFASAAMLGWLRARRIDWRVALACALLFLLDPVFAQSYRGARVDAWTMGFMLSGLWAIRAMLVDDNPQRPLWQPRPGHLVAAICVALAGLFWVSAILLIPLLIHELWCDRNHNSSVSPHQHRVLLARDLAWVGVLSLLVCGLLLLPIWQNIRQSVNDIANATTAVAVGGSAGHAGTANSVTLGKAFVEAFKYNPWPLLVGGLFCVRWKRWPLALALATAFTGVILTKFYIHRAVYLLPYLFLSIALAGNLLVQPTARRMMRRVAFGGLTAMLVWASGVTLGARTMVAWKQQDARNYQHMRDLATRAIGPGSHRVYLGCWESYYAGRQLGWKIFCFFSEVPPGDKPWNELLGTMDFAIYKTDDVNTKTDTALRALGFSRTRFDCETSQAEKSPGNLNVAAGYGSYWVYRK